MKKIKKLINLLLVFTLLMCVVGCSSTPATNSGSSSSSEEKASLEGTSLKIYCGGSMNKPFAEIAELFKEKTGCDVEVTYANTGQLHSQIKTSEEGDLFMSAAVEEVEPISEYVSQTKELVRHIPVLAVAEGNPKDIKSLKDLTKEDVTVIIPDTEATPLGKLAKKAFEDLSIYDKVNIPATTTTALEVITAIEMGEADAAIAWKENIKEDNDKVEIVETNDLDNYVKVITAAGLNFCQNEEGLKQFLDFLGTDEVNTIWEKYGYEALSQN
ncbi:MAG: molybdate ABC transporter substrate-binding protein [Intestinibacter sp.]